MQEVSGNFIIYIWFIYTVCMNKDIKLVTYFCDIKALVKTPNTEEVQRRKITNVLLSI